MKILFEYLKYRFKIIILEIIILCASAVVMTLFHVQHEIIFYMNAVCIFILFAAAVFDLINFAKKHITLKNMAEDISIFHEIPAGDNIIEKDYAEIIARLTEEKKEFENAMNAKYSDMTDYYTLWAHQIKTPIAAMKLILQNDDYPRTGELSEDLQRIEQYAEIVMCYLRLGSSTNDFIIKEYDLDGIIRQAVRKFSSQFIRRKIKLVYGPVCKKILTDEKWLLFVIEQVISNALKYTPSGEVEITLSDKNILCIRDTGTGIAAKDIPRIFEKGYTGCNGRADKKASGIGLYLCRLVCGKLGHKISAQSELHKGTKISIDLSRTDIEIE